MDYQKVLKEKAENATNGDKALTGLQYQNHLNLKSYVDRRARHELGLPLFHVERKSWLHRLIGIAA